MNRSRWSSIFAIVASSALALPLSGCFVAADGEAFGDGHVESEARYAGTSKTTSLHYTAGMAVRIESHLGAVRVVRGSEESIEVTFEPFITTEDDAVAAQAQIDQQLDLVARADDEITITAARVTGASAEVGADIVVKLPASFSGDFVIDQVDGAVEADLRGTSPTSTTVETTGRGDVTVAGAAGALAIGTANGNVTVGVTRWSAENGYVHVSESGNIVLEVGAEANGTLLVNAQGGSIVEPATIPAGWSKDEDCDTSSGTYRLGEATGGTVDVWTHSGSITLAASVEASASTRSF